MGNYTPNPFMTQSAYLPPKQNVTPKLRTNKKYSFADQPYTTIST